MRTWHIEGYAGWEDYSGPDCHNLDFHLETSDMFEESDIANFITKRYDAFPVLSFTVNEVNRDRKKKVMDENEMRTFLHAIGRDELNQEKKLMAFLQNSPFCGHEQYGYPRYLKAIRVSLIAQGCDPAWVEGVFRRELDAMYG